MSRVLLFGLFLGVVLKVVSSPSLLGKLKFSNDSNSIPCHDHE
jgi:hypothetical protein